MITPARDPRSRLRLGELSIDVVTFDEALADIKALVARGAGGTVFTPNVDHVVLAEEDPRFRAAYAATSLSLVDGTPVFWASRLLGQRLPEKISGSDLLLPLMELARSCGWRVYLLGGAEGVAASVKIKLEDLFPGIQIVGTDSPRIAIDEAPSERASVVDRLRMARPDLVLVALGSPKQEIWSHEVAEALRPAVLVGIGASFDFLAGVARRAPRWVSAAGLEWLFRLGHEPGRLWRRYLLRDPRFLMILARELRSPRKARVDERR